MVVVLIIAAVVVIAMLSFIAAQKRRDAFAAFAAQYGLQYYPYGLTGGDAGVGMFGFGVTMDPLLGQLQGFPFFQGRDRCQIRDLFLGMQEGQPVYMFVFQWEDESVDSEGNRSTTTYRYGVTATRVPFAYPFLEITHENIFTRIGRSLGFHDIEFESDEFNRKYRITGQDRNEIITLIDPQMIKYLMTCEVSQWMVGPTWLVSVQNCTNDPTQWHREFRKLQQFNELVPQLVKKDTATNHVFQDANQF